MDPEPVPLGVSASLWLFAMRPPFEALLKPCVCAATRGSRDGRRRPVDAGGERRIPLAHLAGVAES